MNTYTYMIGKNLYINLTNKCDNHCSFCIRNNNDGINEYKLWLTKEASASEIIECIKNERKEFDTVVFCGFGEPTYRIDEIVEIAKFVKAKGLKTRINTNGHADLIHNKKTAPMLKGLIDVVSISLNASNKEKYDLDCKPTYNNAFEAMLQYAKDCKEEGIEVVLSVVDVIGKEEIEKCQKLADTLKVRLRVRERI